MMDHRLSDKVTYDDYSQIPRTRKLSSRMRTGQATSRPPLPNPLFYRLLHALDAKVPPIKRLSLASHKHVDFQPYLVTVCSMKKYFNEPLETEVCAIKTILSNERSDKLTMLLIAYLVANSQPIFLGSGELIKLTTWYEIPVDEKNRLVIENCVRECMRGSERCEQIMFAQLMAHLHHWLNKHVHYVGGDDEIEVRHDAAHYLSNIFGPYVVHLSEEIIAQIWYHEGQKLNKVQINSLGQHRSHYISRYETVQGQKDSVLLKDERNCPIDTRFRFVSMDDMEMVNRRSIFIKSQTNQSNENGEEQRFSRSDSRFFSDDMMARTRAARTKENVLFMLLVNTTPQFWSKHHLPT